MTLSTVRGSKAKSSEIHENQRGYSPCLFMPQGFL